MEIGGGGGGDIFLRGKLVMVQKRENMLCKSDCLERKETK